MKGNAQLLLRDIKNRLAASWSFQFLLMVFVLLLVIIAAKANYDFGKEIGASIYFLIH